MNSPLYIILALLVCCICYTGVPYLLNGIRSTGLLTKHSLSSSIFLSFIIGICASNLIPIEYKGNIGNDSFIIAFSILLTYILTGFFKGGVCTLVPSFFGAYIASAIVRQQIDSQLINEFCLSVFIIPLLGGLLTYFLNKFISQRFQASNAHLLKKCQFIKYIVLIGILLFGILACYNCLLLFHFIERTNHPIENFTSIELLFFTILGAIFVFTWYHYKQLPSKSLKISNYIASIYALIIIHVVFNLLCGLSLIYGKPLLVASLQVIDFGILFMHTRHFHSTLFRLLIGSIIIPLSSFLLCIGLIYFAPYNHIVIPLLVGVCFLIRRLIRQINRSFLFEKTLKEEKLRRAEIYEELNKSDMASVTTQIDMLSHKMENKRKELVNLALYIKQQRESFDNFSNQLECLLQLDNIEQIKDELKKQIYEIRENMKFSKEMNQFYTEVDSIHQTFISKLSLKCPNLTEQEKRLAIFLRLGFSSKEIASLLNITVKSVEINRYRFRKRLKLDRDENLVQFIQLL